MKIQRLISLKKVQSKFSENQMIDFKITGDKLERQEFNTFQNRNQQIEENNNQEITKSSKYSQFENIANLFSSDHRDSYTGNDKLKSNQIQKKVSIISNMSVHENEQDANKSEKFYENIVDNKLNQMTIFTPLSRESNHLENFQHSSQNDDSNENNLYQQNMNKVEHQTNMIPREIKLITNKITIQSSNKPNFQIKEYINIEQRSKKQNITQKESSNSHSFEAYLQQQMYSNELTNDKISHKKSLQNQSNVPKNAGSEQIQNLYQNQYLQSNIHTFKQTNPQLRNHSHEIQFENSTLKFPSQQDINPYVNPEGEIFNFQRQINMDSAQANQDANTNQDQNLHQIYQQNIMRVQNLQNQMRNISLGYLEKNKQERIYAESNYVNSNEVALMKKKKNSFIMMEVRRAQNAIKKKENSTKNMLNTLLNKNQTANQNVQTAYLQDQIPNYQDQPKMTRNNSAERLQLSDYHYEQEMFNQFLMKSFQNSSRKNREAIQSINQKQFDSNVQIQYYQNQLAHINQDDLINAQMPNEDIGRKKIDTNQTFQAITFDENSKNIFKQEPINLSEESKAQKLKIQQIYNYQDQYMRYRKNQSQQSKLISQIIDNKNQTDFRKVLGAQTLKITNNHQQNDQNLNEISNSQQQNSQNVRKSRSINLKRLDLTVLNSASKQQQQNEEHIDHKQIQSKKLSSMQLKQKFKNIKSKIQNRSSDNKMLNEIARVIEILRDNKDMEIMQHAHNLLFENSQSSVYRENRQRLHSISSIQTPNDTKNYPYILTGNTSINDLEKIHTNIYNNIDNQANDQKNDSLFVNSQNHLDNDYNDELIQSIDILEQKVAEDQNNFKNISQTIQQSTQLQNLDKSEFGPDLLNKRNNTNFNVSVSESNQNDFISKDASMQSIVFPSTDADLLRNLCKEIERLQILNRKRREAVSGHPLSDSEKIILEQFDNLKPPEFFNKLLRAHNPMVQLPMRERLRINQARKNDMIEQGKNKNSKLLNNLKDEYMYTGLVSKQLEELDQVFKSRQFHDHNLIEKHLDNKFEKFKKIAFNQEGYVQNYELFVANKLIDVDQISKSLRKHRNGNKLETVGQFSQVKTSRLKHDSLPRQYEVEDFKINDSQFVQNNLTKNLIYFLHVFGGKLLEEQKQKQRMKNIIIVEKSDNQSIRKSFNFSQNDAITLSIKNVGENKKQQESQKQMITKCIENLKQQIREKKLRNQNLKKINQEIENKKERLISTNAYLFKEIYQKESKEELTQKLDEQRTQTEQTMINKSSNPNELITPKRIENNLVSQSQLKIIEEYSSESAKKMNVPELINQSQEFNKKLNISETAAYLPSLYRNLMAQALEEEKNDIIQQIQLIELNKEEWKPLRNFLEIENQNLKKRVMMYQEMIRDLRVKSDSQV